ncbi:MAG TPA: outer membrane lipoprotein-sorting protein [Thermoanaerobaculia bacterium]|nr:outer membrane lipoprotein-sorting protein [Thermoanaerobaculia bacterium]
MLLLLAAFHFASSLVLTPVPTSSPEELLRRSDVGALGPDSFRARLALRSGSPAASHEVEIWRSGDAKTLVRFLAPKERGRFLLRLENQLWLLTPGAKKPVRLSPSHRVYGGVRIDEVLGVRLAANYLVESATEEQDDEGALIVLELRARSEDLLFPEVRYVVRVATERPISATYRLRSGREATAVDFLQWHEGDLIYPSRVIVSDLLRKGSRTEIEVLEMEERPVPSELFELDDPSARRALDQPTGSFPERLESTKVH